MGPWLDDRQHGPAAVERTPSDAGLVGGRQRFGLFQFHLFATTLQTP